MTEITSNDIEQLLLLFSRKGQYDARAGEQSAEIHQKCQELFNKDYICCTIDNEKGCLSVNYPSQIIVPIEERSISSKELESKESGASKFSETKFKEIVTKSNLARCRTRFPVPVILCKGKFVCRSSTLACGGEMIFRDMTGLIFNYFESNWSAVKTYYENWGVETEEPESLDSATEIKDSSTNESDPKNSSSNPRNGAFFNELRSQDIKLLKELSVSYICDLMVENKKTKYGLKVSSSEKIDKENRYCEFKIAQLPYPGCEFFKKFKDNNYTAEGLMFDWEQNYVDSPLTLPSDNMVSGLSIHWPNYKLWDIVKLTQNYLKLLVTYSIEGTSSILIHCISGWDRTPLFISLLRMSLWADGHIHSSLSATEIAYLTLAYDWYLFGHDLPSRLKVGEEILFFCFEFLKFITSDDYSSKKRTRKVSSNTTDPSLHKVEEEPERALHTSDSPPSLISSHFGSSTFYTSLNSSQDNIPQHLSSAQSIDSDDDSDSVKSVKLSEMSSSDYDVPPTLVNSVDSTYNNNGLASSSSPVPVPSSRKRIDSMSSNGSWQYVSGTGSLMGSVTSKCSSSEINSNSSSSSNQDNANAMSNQERAEKLGSVRLIMQRAYSKAIECKDGLNSEQYSYFPWRR